MQYEPLPDPERYIRLLKIHQSDSPQVDLISCSLHTTCLEDQPIFAALSYTWGPAECEDSEANLAERENDSEDSCEKDGSVAASPDEVNISAEPIEYIRVNSSKLKVTSNLHSALFQIRDSGSQDYLWIDAICINQNDKDEVSAQVQNMGNIFWQAQKVIVWLGKSDNHTEDVLQVLKHAAQLRRHIRTDKEALDRTRVNLEACLKEFGIPSQVEGFWDHVVLFFRRRWFRRAWIAQETALAHSLEIYCGRYLIHWEDLSDSARFFNKYLPRLGMVSESDARFILKLTPPGLNVMREKCQRSAEEGVAAVRSRRRRLALSKEHIQDCPEFWMVDYLQGVRSYHCLDPRDKVYSVVGLVNALCKLLKKRRLSLCVDYTLSVVDVYRKAMECILNGDRTLDALSLVHSNPRYTIQELPSWVPNFNEPGLNEICSTLHQEDICKDRRAPSFSIAGNSLYACGFRLKSVLESTKRSAVLQEILKFAAKLLLRPLHSMYNQRGNSLIETLFRLLMVDAAPASALPALFLSFISSCKSCYLEDWDREGVDIRFELTEFEALDTLAKTDPRTYCLEHDKFWEELQDFGCLSGEDVVREEMKAFFFATQDKGILYDNAVSRWLGSRIIFRTHDGIVGVGPEVLQPDDEIYLLRGAQTPYALRRIVPTEEDQGTSYQLLGEAFLLGIKYSEYLKNSSLPWESITIK